MKLDVWASGVVSVLDDDGHVVVRKKVGQAAPKPRIPGGRPDGPYACFTEDQSHVWYFGYMESRPYIKLLCAKTLEVVGEHRPCYPTWDDDEEVTPLYDWGEDFMYKVSGTPSVALLFSNGGDDVLILSTLVATPDGIEDPVGSELFRFATGTLDARLMDAVMVGDDRIALLGDVNDITLGSWPECEHVRRTNVSAIPNAECWNLDVEGDVLVVDCYDEETYKPVGKVRLDVGTLERISGDG